MAAKFTENKETGLSPQQNRFQTAKGNPLSIYRELMVGKAGNLLDLLSLEFYSLFAAPLPGILGFGLRSLLLPMILQSSGKTPRVGKSVTVRQPKGIQLGSGVLLDDYSVLDVRSGSREDKNTGIVLEDYVLIGRSSLLIAKDAHLRLRKGCNVSSHCRIASETSVDIGESTLIAAYCYIGPGNHRVNSEGKPQISEGMELKGGVKIGNNCWIGTRATILDGVTIGDNVIIGAHSLVKDNIPSGAIAVGTPAKIISKP